MLLIRLKRGAGFYNIISVEMYKSKTMQLSSFFSVLDTGDIM